MRELNMRRPSHATVVAYLALFVALAGTAVAAQKIQSSDIAKNAVKTKKIADAAVTNAKIANFAVNNSKLADDAVTESKLAQDSVSGNKIQQSSIGTGKLRQGAVETEKIADGAVTNLKLADGAVTGNTVQDGSLGPGDVAQVVASPTFDPPQLDPDECANSTDLGVPGLQSGDDVLVMPASAGSGWEVDIFLEGYGPTGPATIRVRVCNRGASVDAGPLPLFVLGFR